LEGFGKRVDISRRVVSHLLQIETLEHVECFDHRGTLRPEACFENLITSIFGHDWLADFRGKLCKVVRCDQSAIRLHVIADAAGDWAAIEIISRCHQAGVAIVTRASRRKTLSSNDLTQRPRQICLYEDVADFRNFTAGQENAFRSLPLGED